MFSGEARFTKEGLVRGVAAYGSGGGEVFKILKKSMKIFDNFDRKFFSVFYQLFRQNLGKNFEKLEIYICRGFGGYGPPKLANLLKLKS